MNWSVKCQLVSVLLRFDWRVNGHVPANNLVKLTVIKINSLNRLTLIGRPLGLMAESSRWRYRFLCKLHLTYVYVRWSWLENGHFCFVSARVSLSRHYPLPYYFFFQSSFRPVSQFRAVLEFRAVSEQLRGSSRAVLEFKALLEHF